MTEETVISDEEIKRLWRDINFSGSYRGIKTFQLLLKTDLNINVSEERLYKVLKTDQVYLIHLKPKKYIKRRSYDLNYYCELIQCDLGFLFESNSFKYFFLAIDCFSYKIYVEPLKTKNKEGVLEAFKNTIRLFKSDITKVETDQGTEFAGVKLYCKEKKIIFKYKFGKNKAR